VFPVLKDNFRRYNNLSTQPPIWNKTERTKTDYIFLPCWQSGRFIVNPCLSDDFKQVWY
jgi:hypothetical protein